jgi:uncharacterized protein (TIGR00251 family)
MKVIIINVRAFAGAKTNEIGGIMNDAENIKHLRIKTTSPAESGAANQAIINIVSKSCKVSKNKVTLLTGKKSRYKRFSIEFTEEAQIPEFFKSVISQEARES